MGYDLISAGKKKTNTSNGYDLMQYVKQPLATAQPEFYENTTPDYTKYLTTSHAVSAPVTQPVKPSTWDQVKAGDIKGLMSELGLGLSQGLANTGSAKQNVDIANMLTNNPLPGMADIGRQQLAGIQTNQEYLKANPAESLPAIIGKEIPSLPLWMAGEGAVGALGKGIGKLFPSVIPAAEKVGSRIPSFIKGGLTDAAAYGGVVAPTQNIQEGGSLQDLLEREKQVPAIALGGVAARGALKGIGKAVEGTKGVLKPIGVPDAPISPAVNPEIANRSLASSSIQESIVPPKAELPKSGGLKVGEIPARSEVPGRTDFGPAKVEGAKIGEGMVIDPKLVAKTGTPKATAPKVEPVGEKRLSFPDTVAKGEITDPKLAEKIGKTELNYGNITNKDTLEVAKKFIQDDKEAALHLVMSDTPATAESNAVAQLLIKEANDTGKFDHAISMIEKTSQKARTQGQAIQALSMWGKLSPEGVLKYAENTIAKVKTPKQVADIDNATKGLVEAMGKANKDASETIAKEVESGLGPKLKEKPVKQAKETIIKAPKLSDDIIKKLDSVEAAARARLASRKGSLNTLPVDLLADYALIGTVKLAKGAVNLTAWSADMLKEFGDDIKPHLSKIWEQSKKGYDDFAKENKITKLKVDLTPEEQLSDRIKATLADGEPKEKDAVKTMVDTLYKVAKESPLPVNKKVPTDPLTFVSDAIRSRTEYKEVWAKAKAIIKEKYENDPEALALLDDYIGKGIKRTFPENQLKRSVSQGLKEMNVSVGDIVRQHYSVNSQVRDDLVTQLTEKAGLSGEDAKVLEKYVRDRMKELTKVKKEQALAQIFKPRVVRPRKDISEKIIELSNLGGFQNQKYKMLAGEKLGVPTLDEGTAKSIVEQSKNIQVMDDGREKEVAIAKMLDTIATKVPPTMLQKISTLQTMAQLLNPKTSLRNIVGNVGFAGLENVSNVVGAGLDVGTSLITKQRTRGLPSLPTQTKGAKKGFSLGLEDAVKGINTSSAKTQFDLNTTKTFRKGALGKLETAMNIELRATDRAFYQAAYDDSLRSQMKLAKVTEPTDAMKEIADYDGLYKTFQDDSVASSVFSGLKKLLNDPKHFMGKAKDREALAFGIGDFVIKYPKTPGNLLSRGLDYSPFGFINTVIEAGKPLFGKEFNQRAFVDSFSRAITGTGSLVGTGALLHRVGIISGKPDDDPDVAALNRQVGLGEYKINVSALKRFILGGFNPDAAKLKKDDTLISYNWMQPLALGIAMGADIDKNGASAQGFVGTVLSSLATGVNTFADQPVMQGITNMFGQKDFSSGVLKILQGVPASFVPTLLNQFKQLSDNQKRITYSPDWSEMSTNLAKSKIPVVGSKLPQSYGSLGEKLQAYQDGGNNPFNVLFNPAFITKYAPSKEAAMAMDAYKKTGETGQIPTTMPKFFTVGDQKFDLTTQEYSEIQRIVGESTRKGFSKIPPGLKTDKQIERMVETIGLAKLEGKKAILKGRGIKFTQKGNTLKLKK